MIKSYLRKRKLISIVEELAIYNDKGVHWNKHDSEQASTERKRLADLLENQVSLIGRDNIPLALLQAFDDGEICTDITGKYIEIAKQVKL